MTPRAVRVSAKRGKKCKMMKESQTYLSDMRPRFEPFVIDCGKIPAYRYQGSLAVGTESRRRSPRPRRSRSSKTC